MIHRQCTSKTPAWDTCVKKTWAETCPANGVAKNGKHISWLSYNFSQRPKGDSTLKKGSKDSFNSYKLKSRNPDMVVTFIPCQLITGWKLKTRKLVFHNVCPSSPCVKIGTQCVNGLDEEKISWWGSISRHIHQKLENIPRQSWCHLWPPSKSSGCLSPRNCIQLFMDKTGQFSWILSTLGFLRRQVSSTKLVSIGSASPARLIRRDKDRLALRPPLGPEHLANFQRRSSVLPWQDELDCNHGCGRQEQLTKLISITERAPKFCWIEFKSRYFLILQARSAALAEWVALWA